MCIPGFLEVIYRAVLSTIDLYDSCVCFALANQFNDPVALKRQRASPRVQ